jgi:hypothetical protein
MNTTENTALYAMLLDRYKNPELAKIALAQLTKVTK